MSGKLYAIGTGPGAADLITVRGARVLGQLDVLYAPAGRKGGDSLSLSIVREYLGAATRVKSRHFPMNQDADEKNGVWDAVAQDMAADVEQGLQVGFITLGDAMLYSTWVFLLARLRCRIAIDIIPGVTSFACIAARVQVPLAMESQSLAVMACTDNDSALEAALLSHDCIVLMKVYGRFARIQQLLRRLGLIEYALLMANASLPDEACFLALDDVAPDQALPYFSTVVVNKRWRTAADHAVTLVSNQGINQ
ncbi:cobalt-factor II C(20)-methyltransferase [Acerihabitans sp. TG2]|uniref:cobalt-factor II C(20)-methyltransferase n=1 Tax=Acerihabitans sp. TG2 TaxID=3096008 RepID=UPI002B22CB8A|nr:cobalt-factor II C(20)-methyltransferase [Acerihabitans sp. TG2]MEA9389333.1 cobalt-factor II C(20)-methyltransferase [Acerihabitans sp. TG2]